MALASGESAHLETLREPAWQLTRERGEREAETREGVEAGAPHGIRVVKRSYAHRMVALYAGSAVYPVRTRTAV
jgi:hypothetical protein